MLANVDNFQEEEEPRKSIYNLVIYTVKVAVPDYNTWPW